MNGIAIDYFLYQEDYLQLPKWNNTLSSLSNDLSQLKAINPQQQEHANTILNDLSNLNQSFANVVTYLQNTSTVSVRIDPAFQLKWSNMTFESHALAMHSSQLSNALDNQAHQANNTNILLIVSLVGTFGVFLAIIYLMVFRRNLKIGQ